MTPSLKESALAFVSRLEWVDLFPVPREYLEARSWRGPELHLNSNGFTVFRSGGPGIDLRGQPPEAFCETVDELKRILAGRKSICLSLDKVLTLTSYFDIPSTSDRMTEKILDLRRSQEIPVKPADYLHGWFDDPAHPSGVLRHVVDIVVRRDMVERVFSQLRSIGTGCEMVFVRNGLGSVLPFAWDINGLAHKRNEIKSWIKRTLLSLICAGFSGVLLVSALLNQQSNTITRIDEQLAALQPEAKRATKQAHANDALSSQVALLVDRTSPSRLASVQLEQLAKQLPDDMVLTAFRFDSGSIELEGFATAPEQLIELLGKQKNVSNVAFLSPVFRNPGETKSRFVVSFLVKGGSK
jgi:Fimbrial assembly protein (PilN)